MATIDSKPFAFNIDEDGRIFLGLPGPMMAEFRAEELAEASEAAFAITKMAELHIPAHHEHPFRTNVNTYSGSR